MTEKKEINTVIENRIRIIRIIKYFVILILITGGIIFSLDEYQRIKKNEQEEQSKICFEKGIDRLSIEKFREAISLFDESLKLNPLNLTAREYKAMCLFELKDYSESIIEYEKLLKDQYYKNRKVSLLMLGKIHFIKEEFKKSLEYYSAVKKRTPEIENVISIIRSKLDGKI